MDDGKVDDGKIGTIGTIILVIALLFVILLIIFALASPWIGPQKKDLVIENKEALK